jgi:hypothetical protein
MSVEKGKEYFTISVVSSMFNIHPQTLRLYEREGLLRPERSAGNTRLYSRQDIEHLSTILNLTRDGGQSRWSNNYYGPFSQAPPDTAGETDVINDTRSGGSPAERSLDVCYTRPAPVTNLASMPR